MIINNPVGKLDYSNQPVTQPASKIGGTGELAADSVRIGEDLPQSEKDWTILIYMNNNNNLGAQGKAKLRYQLKDLDKSDNMNIAVLSSVQTQKNWNHPNSIDAALYLVGDHSVEKLEKLPPRNMASPDTLQQFIEMGMQRWPAKRYMVVMQSHGSAWQGCSPDDIHKDRTDLGELKQALDGAAATTGKRPDIIAFDMCLMGNLETAYQLRDTAGIMIASEEVEKGMDSEYAHDVSAPYRKIFSSLSEKIDSGVEVGPETLARDWIQACEGSWTTPTQSAIDLSLVEPLARSVDSLAQAVLEGNTPLDVFRDIARGTKNMHAGDKPVSQWTESFSSSYYLKDLKDFAERIIEDPRIHDCRVKDSAGEVIEQLGRAVIANQAGSQYNTVTKIEYSNPVAINDTYDGERNHGLSIFAPTNGKIAKFIEEEEKITLKYRDTDFAKDTAWGKLVDLLSQSDSDFSGSSV